MCGRLRVGRAFFTSQWHLQGRALRRAFAPPGLHRQWKMMLAITSIAVTANICASASEAALLVASFMPFSLDSGVTHRCARRRERRSEFYTRNTPRRLFALIESPLSEYRPCQGQIVMRRHFDLRARPLQHRHQCPQATGTSARPAFTADGSRFFKSKESAFDTGGKSSLETILRRPIPLSHGRYLVTLEDAGN